MTHIDLSQLSELKTINKKLMSGYHISEHDTALFQQLDLAFESYQALFNALGYTLVHDARGYYYLQTDEGTANMGKISRAFALTIFVLIEHFANAGKDPLSALFDTNIDLALMMELVQTNKSLFDQLEIFSGSDMRRDVCLRMVRLGIARETEDGFKILAPAHRYLDALSEMADFQNQREANPINEDLPS